MADREMADADSVPITAGQDTDNWGAKRGPGGGTNIKILVALFIVFMFVVSDLFTDNIVSGFPSATKGRTVTSYGTVLQGIFLVIFYVIIIHLTDRKVL